MKGYRSDWLWWGVEEYMSQIYILHYTIRWQRAGAGTHYSHSVCLVLIRWRASLCDTRARSTHYTSRAAAQQLGLWRSRRAHWRAVRVTAGASATVPRASKLSSISKKPVAPRVHSSQATEQGTAGRTVLCAS